MSNMADVQRKMAEIMAKRNGAVIPAPAVSVAEVKATKQTDVKLSVTNNRVALTVKYPNGEVLKVSATPSATRVNIERPAELGKPTFTLKSLSAMVSKETADSPAAQFEKFKLFFEATSSIEDAINKAK